MSRDNVEDIYPLSPMQQVMLFHTLRAPGSGVYCERLSCTIRGEVEIVAFEMAWQHVVDRHPALRTVFIWEHLDEPMQVVHEHVKVTIEHHDWSLDSPVTHKQRLERYLEEDRRKEFDLSAAPLMRLALVRLRDNAYFFVWSSHHLILDGWSLALVTREVLGSYSAFTDGAQPKLEPCRPYRDYIAWLGRQNLSKAEPFWRRTLSGFTAPTPLVVDRTGSATTDSGKWATAHMSLAITSTSQLEGFVQRNCLTMSTVVQGMWACLLSRYSGEDSVLFGVTMSGRPASLVGVGSVVGLLINTIPIIVRVEPEKSVCCWLKHLQEEQMEMREYEHISPIDVQRWANLPSGVPLFES